MFVRNCPQCNKELEYTNIKNRNKANKLKTICGSCRAKEVQSRPDVKQQVSAFRKKAYIGKNNPFYGKKHSPETIAKIRANRRHEIYKTSEYRKKISSITTGSKNPMFGKNIEEIWRAKYGESGANERRIALSKKRSENAKGSKNSMYGKPPSVGAGSGWGGWYKDWYFRSLKELTYVLQIEENNWRWESAECKQYAIPYTDNNGVEKTYRADFVVNGKMLVEVKPERLMNSVSNCLKRDAAIGYCKERGLQYVMIDPGSLCPQRLLDLCKQGTVKLDRNRLEKLEYICLKKKQQ